MLAHYLASVARLHALADQPDPTRVELVRLSSPAPHRRRAWRRTRRRGWWRRYRRAAIDGDSDAIRLFLPRPRDMVCE